MKTYHVGLLALSNTAVFQFRKSVDNLSCEILEYFGEHLTTKVAAKSRLTPSKKVAVLVDLNSRYPGRNFNRVSID